MTKKERAKIKAEIRQEIKSRKLQKTDGLGPYEIKKIRQAVRDVWQHCHARRLVVVRCTGKDGFSYCELCREKTPTLKIDHIAKVGEVDDGFLRRMFVPSVQLQGLCKPCHDVKTKQERDGKKPKRSKDWGF